MPPDAKKEAPAAPPIDVKEHAYALMWMFLVSITVIFTFFIVLFDQQSAQNFVYILNGLDILFALIIIAAVANLSTFMIKFKKQTKRLEKFFESRYVPPKENDKELSPIEQKLARAKQHIESRYKEEWKIGIIELDNILRELLKEKFTGSTVGELLQDAEKKGFDKLSEAWEGHKIRNKIVHEGIKYELDQSLCLRTLNNYLQAFRSLGLN
jgi:hypothetical protein